MAIASRYQVRDKQGKLLAEGTAAECGEKLGVSGRVIYCHFASPGTYNRWDITLLPDEPDQVSIRGDMIDLIKAWDDLVTPIREYYGIPRYRSRSDKRA